MNIAMFSAFGIYLMALILISLFFYKKMRQVERKEDTSDSFFVGGQAINYWVTAISAHASDMSDWLFMAFPAAIFMHGMSEIWIALGLVIGMFLSWHFVAPKLRTESEKLNAFTLSSFFEKKFKDKSGTISFLVALMSGFFFTLYLPAGIKGVAYIFNSCFGIDYKVGALICFLTVILYTIIGGFLAIAWTDFFQGIFLLLVIIFVPIFAIFKIGSIQPIIDAAAQKSISLSPFSNMNPQTILSIILGPLAWGLGYFGMPHILGKFMGAKNATEMHKSKYIGVSWQILALLAAAGVGLVGLAYFNQANLPKPEFIFIELAKNLFPPFIAGLVLCAVLAATLSTMDSQVLVLASIFAQDIYKKFINKKASKKQVILVYKFSIALVCLIAFLISLDEGTTIMGIVKYAWSGLGASFGPLMLVSLYYKSANKYGAIAGILGGGITSAIWQFFNITLNGQAINPIAPGFLISLILILLVSRITKK